MLSKRKQSGVGAAAQVRKPVRESENVHVAAELADPAKENVQGQCFCSKRSRKAICESVRRVE